MHITKYVYIPREDWVSTWLDGGEIPIQPASLYRVGCESARQGKMTTDEVLNHESSFPINKLKSLGLDLANIRDLDIVGATFKTKDGSVKKLPDIVNASYYEQDGLVLCLSNTVSRLRSKKLGHRKFVVQINDIRTLFEVIDKQLGGGGQFGPCRYTQDHNRNAFLKSIRDSWQDEFRFFWPRDNPVTAYVEIPKGLCTLVRTFNY